jgi:hypothetical protein
MYRNEDAGNEDAGNEDAVHAACEAAGGRILVFLAQASHKIKKKAEQLACDSAIQFMP